MYYPNLYWKGKNSYRNNLFLRNWSKFGIFASRHLLRSLWGGVNLLVLCVESELPCYVHPAVCLKHYETEGEHIRESNYVAMSKHVYSLTISSKIENLSVKYSRPQGVSNFATSTKLNIKAKVLKWCQRPPRVPYVNFKGTCRNLKQNLSILIIFTFSQESF